MSSRRALVVAAVLSACWCTRPASLPAQAGAGRASLDDLVRRVTEAPGAADLAAHPAVRLPGDEGRLARAWVKLARAERDTTWKGLPDLADEFSVVVTAHPDWALANLGLARTGLLMHGRRQASAPMYAGQLRGRHFRGYSWHLAAAAASPGQLGAGTAFLAERLVEEGDRLQPDAVMVRLRALAGRPDADARLDVVVARDARSRDSMALALEHLDRYLARGGDSGVGLLERARTLAMQGALDEAVADYRAGLRAGTADGRALYRADIAWVATTDELARYDALADGDVAAFVERFWTLRDARDFQATDARLREHLRRWAHVHRAFRVWGSDRRDHVAPLFLQKTSFLMQCVNGPLSLEDVWDGDPSRPRDARGPERVLDHRAVLWMRHGEPVRRLWNTQARVLAPEFARTSLVLERLQAGEERQALAATGGGMAQGLEIRLRNPINPVVQRDEVAEAGVLARVGGQNGRGGAADPGSEGSAAGGAPDDMTPRDEAWLYLIDGVPRVYLLAGSVALGVDQPSTMYTAYLPEAGVLQRLLAGLALVPDDRSWALLDAAGGRREQWGNRAAARGPQANVDWVCSQYGQGWMQAVEEDARIAARTDGNPRRFPIMLAGSARAYALGQPARGTGRLVLAIGADTRSLTPEGPDGGAPTFPATLEVAAIDPVAGAAARRTSDVRFRRLGEGEPQSAAVVAMPLTPGQREVRVLLHQGEARGATYAAAIDPAAADGGLALSDVLVGSEGSSPVLELDGRSIPVSPSGAFTPRAALALYYELYDLRPGTTYKSRLTMRRTDGRKDAVSVAFTDQATAPTLALTRRLTLPDVPRGEYVLELTVTDAETGRSAVRRQDVYIVER